MMTTTGGSYHTQAAYEQQVRAYAQATANANAKRRSNMKNKPLTLILAYLVVAFLTFAYTYDSIPEPKADDYHAKDKREMGSFVAAVAWPLYLGGTVALIAVRTAKAPSSCK